MAACVMAFLVCPDGRQQRAWLLAVLAKAAPTLSGEWAGCSVGTVVYRVPLSRGLHVPCSQPSPPEVQPVVLVVAVACVHVTKLEPANACACRTAVPWPSSSHWNRGRGSQQQTGQGGRRVQRSMRGTTVCARERARPSALGGQAVPARSPGGARRLSQAEAGGEEDRRDRGHRHMGRRAAGEPTRERWPWPPCEGTHEAHREPSSTLPSVRTPAAHGVLRPSGPAVSMCTCVCFVGL